MGRISVRHGVAGDGGDLAKSGDTPVLPILFGGFSFLDVLLVDLVGKVVGR
jgi:hypothetical protein